MIGWVAVLRRNVGKRSGFEERWRLFERTSGTVLLNTVDSGTMELKRHSSKPDVLLSSDRRGDTDRSGRTNTDFTCFIQREEFLIGGGGESPLK